MFNELNRQKSLVSMRLEEQLQLRYEQRRNDTLVDLLKYLHNPTSIRNNSNSILQTNKEECIKLAESLHERLFCLGTNPFENQDSDSNESVVSQNSENQTTRAQRLKRAIEKENNAHPKKVVSSIPPLVSDMKREFIYFANRGERTTRLEQLYCALKNIKPSSVDSERAFSITGMFLTKFRCRLSDDSIDALTFLRQHFIEDKHDNSSSVE